MEKRVAIIGAGCSGLTAIKACLEDGIIPVCFERSNEIGGLWNYSEKYEEGQGSVMKSTVINVSKEQMAFSDFPIPKEFPMFMHHSLVQKYFQMYTDHFDLRRHIHFKKEVMHCKPVSNFDDTGKWTLTIKDKETGQVFNEIFDGVMSASGHHASPHIPNFKGLDQFRGRTIHSVKYRDGKEFTGQEVLVVGLGNSGSDIANDLTRNSSKVVLSTRSGSWVIQRVGDHGLPFDMLGTTRAVQYIENTLPFWLLNKLTEKELNVRFDHEKYGIKPTYPPRAQDPLISDEFHLRIANGMVEIRPNIDHFTETGVVFTDGTTFEDIDAVIFATGFHIGFPYLDKTITDVKDNVVNLYKLMFPPDLSKPTLAVIGCIQPLGSVSCIVELQSRVFTGVLTGRIKLPSSAVMWREIFKRRRELEQRYHNSLRHTVMVDFIPYMDELAVMVACKPPISKLWFTDPKLAYACVFDPCAAYQYRLTGPNRWDGAREAIITQWERTLFPLQTKRARSASKRNNGKYNRYLVLSVSVLGIIAYISLHRSSKISLYLHKCLEKVTSVI